MTRQQKARTSVAALVTDTQSQIQVSVFPPSGCPRIKYSPTRRRW
jgi:hypothetical protein